MIPLKVQDAMTRTVLAVRRNTSLVAARRLFAKHHVSGAPVIDADGVPVGMITQADLIDPDWKTSKRAGMHLYFKVEEGQICDVGVVSGEDDAERGIVEDVMSPYVMTINPRAPLMTAVRHLLLGDVHRLMVADGERLVGIVTTVDILRALVDLEDRAVHAPSGASTPFNPSH